MFEASMVSRGVYVLRAGQLPNSTQPLHGESIDNVPFNFSEPNVTVDWVLDEAPKLLRFLRLGSRL